LGEFLCGTSGGAFSLDIAEKLLFSERLRGMDTHTEPPVAASRKLPNWARRFILVPAVPLLFVIGYIVIEYAILFAVLIFVWTTPAEILSMLHPFFSSDA
jgi:hypothetical protein